MFEAFYGLRTDPFRLTPDHHFSFEHEHFSKAKAYIDYALVRGEGFVMITGKPGTGKTTLVADLQARLTKSEITTATINCTQLDAEALLLISAYEFGLQIDASNKAVLLRELMAFFQREHQAGRRVLLVIDEAQDLSVEALEELRLLTNLQRAGRPLLQIILLGQSALLSLIRRPEMLQVHQRIVAATHLKSLTPEETVSYVRYRLKTAGWTGDPIFRPGVLKAIYAYSTGIPRLINQICSRLLLRGFSLEQHELTRNDAHEVLKELREEGLIQLSRSGTAQTNQSATVQWSAIDQGLYPEKSAETPIQQALTKRDISESPPSPEAPVNEVPALTPEHVTPPPIEPESPPEPAPNPQNFAPVTTAPNLSELSSDAREKNIVVENSTIDDHGSKTNPRSSKTLRNLVIASAVLSLLLLSFLAGMVMNNAELRQSLSDRFQIFSTSITDAARELLK